MNYKLAKQLKDAGFEYSKAASDQEFEEGIIIVPTLSELIEACGGEQKALLCLFVDGEERWSYSVDGKSGKVGKTPKEAVANLYIELSK